MELFRKLERGAELLGFPLSGHAIESLAIYLQELLIWNRRINLTALDDPEQVVIYHFLDSLTALQVFRPEEGSTLADLGTGAGLPGVVLQIACPDLRVVLVEASKKKVAFLHHLRGKLQLPQMTISEGPMETLSTAFDRLISRAVSPLRVLERASPLLKREGEVILFFKATGDLPFGDGWTVRRVAPITLPFVLENRRVVAYGRTPEAEKA